MHSDSVPVTASIEHHEASAFHWSPRTTAQASEFRFREIGPASDALASAYHRILPDLQGYRLRVFVRAVDITSQLELNL
jgi:hypothetical protein